MLQDAYDTHLFVGRFGGNRAVASFGFGFVERLIGKADHLLGCSSFLIARGNADAYSHADFNFPGPGLSGFTVLPLPAPVLSTDGKKRLLNHLSHRVQVGEGLSQGFVGKNHGEFLSTVTESLAPTGNPPHLAATHPYCLLS